jgi:hypothetical protein
MKLSCMVLCFLEISLNVRTLLMFNFSNNSSYNTVVETVKILSRSQPLVGWLLFCLQCSGQFPPVFYDIDIKRTHEW